MQLTPHEIHDIHERKVREVMEFNAHLRETDRVETPKRKGVYQTLLTLLVRVVNS